MKLPKKERIFICHDKEKIKDIDIRKNMPVWGELKSLLEQFKEHTSKLKLPKEEEKRLELLTFYLEKIVEHYDFEVPEFSFSVLCSIIEAIGKYDSPQINGGFGRFELAIKKYFDNAFTNDVEFMNAMDSLYKTLGRCSFSHAAERLHWSAQLCSKANLPLIKDTNGKYSMIGNKHLFQIAVEVITNYFESKEINQ